LARGTGGVEPSPSRRRPARASNSDRCRCANLWKYPRTVLIRLPPIKSRLHHLNASGALQTSSQDQAQQRIRGGHGWSVRLWFDRLADPDPTAVSSDRPTALSRAGSDSGFAAARARPPFRVRAVASTATPVGLLAHVRGFHQREPEPIRGEPVGLGRPP
jgi:hypothetical protein